MYSRFLKRLERLEKRRILRVSRMDFASWMNWFLEEKNMIFLRKSGRKNLRKISREMFKKATDAELQLFRQERILERAKEIEFLERVIKEKGA